MNNVDGTVGGVCKPVACFTEWERKSFDSYFAFYYSDIIFLVTAGRYLALRYIQQSEKIYLQDVEFSETFPMAFSKTYPCADDFNFPSVLCAVHSVYKECKKKKNSLIA